MANNCQTYLGERGWFPVSYRWTTNAKGLATYIVKVDGVRIGTIARTDHCEYRISTRDDVTFATYADARCALFHDRIHQLLNVCPEAL